MAGKVLDTRRLPRLRPIPPASPLRSETISLILSTRASNQRRPALSLLSRVRRKRGECRSSNKGQNSFHFYRRIVFSLSGFSPSPFDIALPLISTSHLELAQFGIE